MSNADSPPVTRADFATEKYARSWSDTGLIPEIGSQWLLKRNDNDDWVRFEQHESWCGWNNTGDCHGVHGHLQLTKGQLYDMSGTAIPGYDRFAGCMYEEHCGTGGGD
eukprot:gene56657-biopygen37882